VVKNYTNGSSVIMQVRVHDTGVTTGSCLNIAAGTVTASGITQGTCNTINTDWFWPRKAVVTGLGWSNSTGLGAIPSGQSCDILVQKAGTNIGNGLNWGSDGHVANSGTLTAAGNTQLQTIQTGGVSFAAGDRMDIGLATNSTTCVTGSGCTCNNGGSSPATMDGILTIWGYETP
jgi:hypothetical protein